MTAVRSRTEITFYFSQEELIKVVVQVQYNEGPFQATYYFDKGVNIYKQEALPSNKKLLWNVDEINAQSKQYLEDFPAVATVLEHGKK